MARLKRESYRDLPHGPPGTPQLGRDARHTFSALTAKTQPDIKFRNRFLENRARTASTHPFLSAPQRQAALRELKSLFSVKVTKESAPPVPGGVGYGTFYSQAFRIAFSEGTALYWEVVCPSAPGGNVSDYLYITGMNRASLGVEALVKYFGQTDPHFIVFDWSRDEQSRWQHEVSLSSMGSYLRQEISHGVQYQVLPLMNMTYQVSQNKWINQVWLLNQADSNWDLAYQYGYVARSSDQHGEYVGSWGPIVETFQDAYRGTNSMGALNTQLSTQLNGQWGIWSSLRQADSQIRVDSKGFLPVFLDPNASWVIRS